MGRGARAQQLPGSGDITPWAGATWEEEASGLGLFLSKGRGHFEWRGLVRWPSLCDQGALVPCLIDGGRD